MRDRRLGWNPRNYRSSLYSSGSGGADVTGPVVSSVVATQLSQTSMRITWTTDEASNSRVDYGATAAYGSNQTDASLVTSHQIDLTGLSVGTYHYQITSVDAATNSTATSDATFAVADITGPVISSVVVTQLTNTSVRVTWTTDEASNSRVDYGATSSYGANVTDASNVTSHSVDVTGLTTAPQTYHYKVTSVDAATNSTATSDATFATVPILPTTNLFGKFESDSGITASASRVSQWDDLSGAAHHLLQATAADKPLVVANQINGLQVIRFASANTELMQSASFTAETQPNTIYVVGKAQSGVAQTFVDGLGAAGRNRISLTTSNQIKIFAASTVTGVGTTFGGVFVSVCAIFNSASGAIYVNNFTTADVTGNTGGESMDGFTVGVTRGLTEYLNGDIAAIYAFGAAHDQTTRNLVRDYINWKWAQSVV